MEVFSYIFVYQNVETLIHIHCICTHTHTHTHTHIHTHTHTCIVHQYVKESKCIIEMLSSYFTVFVNFISKLRENVNPYDICSHLLAQGMITSNEKAEIDNQMLIPQRRMDKLLTAVQKAINIDPEKCETFAKILGKERKYSALVKEMRGNFAFLIVKALLLH